MQNNELEKILQEKADNTKMRDFSQVWDEIKDEIKPKEKEKKLFWKKKFFLTFAPALLVICIALSPLLFQKPTPPPEEVFYFDELIVSTVTAEETLEGLSLASITHVDLSKYVLTGTSLFCAEDGVAKGARLTFYNESTMSFFAEMKLYDKSVELNLDIENLYDTNCKVNFAEVYYKFKSAESGFYEYSVYAIYNNVKYVIEYSGASDNLMEFLTNFFA